MSIVDREEKRKSAAAAFFNTVPTSASGGAFNVVDFTVATPPKVEGKSKRMTLMLRPSLYKKATDKCEAMDISLTECINQILQTWCDT